MFSITNIMAEQNNNYSFESKNFKAFQKHKQYVDHIDKEKYDVEPMYIEQNYFNCLHCGKVNLVEDVKKEEADNRTFRARYKTWYKLKQLAHDKGGSIENAVNYLLYLEENFSNSIEDSNEINIAGFNDNKKKGKDIKK